MTRSDRVLRSIEREIEGARLRILKAYALSIRMLEPDILNKLEELNREFGDEDLSESEELLINYALGEWIDKKAGAQEHIARYRADREKIFRKYGVCIQEFEDDTYTPPSTALVRFGPPGSKLQINAGRYRVLPRRWISRVFHPKHRPRPELPPRYLHHCVMCGRPFFAGRIDARFCSQRCRDKNPSTLTAQPRYDRVCDECGAAFTASRIDARFCSAGCRKRASRRTTGDQKKL